MRRIEQKLPPEVSALLDALLAGAREALGDNFVGAYVCGSLALGSYDPATSDVDLLIVTERPVSGAEFDALAALHARIPAGYAPGQHNYEVSYIDRASLKRFRPGQRRHPSTGTDWPFGWREHRENWVLERWTVREHGVALHGPHPETLIDPIPAGELRDAARSELAIRVIDWAKEWRDGIDPPSWLLSRYYQAFEVETVCRALYTLERGELISKPQAVAWALQALPERWQALLDWSQRYRADKARDASQIPEIIRFVRWAAAHAGAGDGPDASPR